MTVAIISRAQWGARSPKEIQTVSRSKRTGFVVHHSGANAHQTVRAIQDYQMDVRGWSDIGYNFLIDLNGRVFEGRGWDRIGAHATGYNTATIGVCVIGNYDKALPPKLALGALALLYDMSTGVFGRRLALFGHRELATHTTHTDCPGDQLYAYVHHGLVITPGNGVPVPMDHRPGSRNLAYRSGAPELVGADVGFVQRYIGPARVGAVDDHYGPRTEAGVRWYQGMRGIRVDGEVGPVTWSNMGVQWTG